MSIFLNRYQIRHVHNNSEPGTWESVAVGVFSKPGSIPIVFGIEMRYEVGDVPIRELVADDGDMHLTTYPQATLQHAEVHELARTGFVQTKAGAFQMLALRR